MELIRDLEEKFQRINAKLNSNVKVESAGRIYSNDLERIEHLFNDKKQRYKNGLNECRQEMLDQLIQKRNEQLEQVNEFNQSSQQKSLTQFKTLADSIKSKNLSFSRGIASVFESLMSRSKLGNPLKFVQLVRYEKFMPNEVTICLDNAKHLLDPDFYISIDALPFQQFLIFSINPHIDGLQLNMVVLNKSGDLIHFKTLQTIIYYHQFSFKVNLTNIITHNETNLSVEVYNFQLELVHSIKLDQYYNYNYGFKLNNYEIAFSNSTYDGQLIIACYNHKTAQPKKKKISINTDELKRFLGFEIKEPTYSFYLVDLNDQFLFIDGVAYSRNSNEKTPYALFVLNRYDGNSLFKYFESHSRAWSIYNNEVCSETFGIYPDTSFLVFDLNSAGDDETFTRVFEAQEGMFGRISSTSNIYSINCHGDLNIQFNKY